MLAALLLLIDSEEDQQKFEALYHQYKQLMFYIAKDYFYTDTGVEDAVQEAFIRIIKNFSKIGDVNCPQTKHFIVIVIRSTCIDLLRTGKRKETEIPLEEILKVEVPDDFRPGAKLEEQEAYERILAALRSLPQNYRDVMTLRHVQKLSMEQISGITGLSLDSVKKILQRGKRKLEKALEEMEVV